MDENKKNPILRKILISIIVLIVALVGVIVWRAVSVLNAVYEPPSILEMSTPIEDEPVNILFLGIDQNPGRSDTIIFVSFNPSTNKILALSIPRDTLAEIPGNYRQSGKPYGEQKINHAHAYGGVRLSVKTVEKFLGVHIHYYARVNYTVLHNFVDLIGGVRMNVPFDMNYKDEAGNLYINLQKGEQVLDGKKAEQFLRWRRNLDGTSDGLGDVGRVARQQDFLRAAIKQMLKPANLLKLDKIEDLIASKVVTNIPQSLVIQMLRDRVIKFDFENDMLMRTIPGDYSSNGIYWDLSDDDRIELGALLNAHLMPNIDRELTVKIYNYGASEEKLTDTLGRLKLNPMLNVELVSKVAGELALTEVHSYTKDSIASYVAGMIGAENNIYLGDSADITGEKIDIIIKLGKADF